MSVGNKYGHEFARDACQDCVVPQKRLEIGSEYVTIVVPSAWVALSLRCVQERYGKEPLDINKASGEIDWNHPSIFRR